ncbi:hypothetical protein PC121_g9676 [Phytophthora cactorum]|nr:hypothetical protein PC120_g10865 [Phytophthora cactorum]KAG3069846.1 hypothetical protein PC121_g9676 [Phytophthora cactorum]
MRWDFVLLTATIPLLASSDALSASKFSTMASSAALTSTTSIVAETTNTRFLRVGKTSNTDRYASKGIDRNFVVDDASINNPEERGGWAGALEKLKSLKIIKSVSRSVSKTTNLFSDKISPALSLKSKLQVWSNNKKSVPFVRKELGMEGLMLSSHR